MAHEVVNRTERIILVQINVETKQERGLYKDKYGGGFQPSTNIMNATDFETQEEAEKVSQALNMLYDMTNSGFKAHVVREVVERTFLDDGAKDVDSDGTTNAKDETTNEN
ncbi:hypothetical protein [Staphylococcus capitis]|uniref:hypothetical protein n=1 Tax=Staphylococcus capitis TaxID=29388 RepID=UPI00145AFA29|nr:hypothetical protein [Staphylococcus capitis]NMK90898.1 hypothetical protein [Staphylococcus capitis]